MSYQQIIAYHLIRNLPWYLTPFTIYVGAMKGWNIYKLDTGGMEIKEQINPNIAIVEGLTSFGFIAVGLIPLLFSSFVGSCGGLLVGSVGGSLMRSALKQTLFYQNLKRG